MVALLVGAVGVVVAVVLFRGPSGILTGHAEPCLGPLGYAAPGDHVEVVVTATDGNQVDALDLMAPFTFRVELSPGQYRVEEEGDSTMAQTVTVEAGRSTAVSLGNNCG